MDEWVHSMFRNEMSAQARPSFDGMAQEVLARGRRARRVRRAKIASAALVAVGLVGGVAVAVPSIAGGHSVAANRGAVAKSASRARSGTQTAPVGGAKTVPAPVILTDASLPAGHIPQPPGAKAATSSAAVLDELLKLLPPGATSNYAFYGGLGAQTYLDGENGLGMIRIVLYKGSLNPDACTSAVPSDMTRSCITLPSGATVLTTRIPDNCIEPLTIDVDHGDGTVVEIDVATCLPWNSHSNPPAHMAITAAQAEQIAANPAWGAFKMEAALVRASASRFAGIPGNSHAAASVSSCPGSSGNSRASASRSGKASASRWCERASASGSGGAGTSTAG
jgi:hypothetical protein